MKRRKNAIYTGQSKRVSTGPRGDSKVVNRFYKQLNSKLLLEDEIEIIPQKQVKPTRTVYEQSFIVADYCVRKILPEMTSLFHWGDEVTPRLRALAPIVDKKTAQAAHDAANAAANAADAAYGPAHGTVGAAHATHVAAYYVTGAAIAYAANVAAVYFDGTTVSVNSRNAANVAADATAACVYNALITCIEAGDEAAYDRIIDLTNKMLESL